MRVGELMNCLSARLKEGAAEETTTEEEEDGKNPKDTAGISFKILYETYEALKSDDRGSRMKTCLLYTSQEPYILSFFQVCCDYILAFAALGLAGLFAKQSHGLLKGYIIAVIARGAFHSLGGYLYWMSYMPDNFPKSLTCLLYTSKGTGSDEVG